MKNLYYELNQEEIKMIKEIEELTVTNFEIKDNLIEIDNLIQSLYNIFYEYKQKDEEFREYKEKVKNNYVLKEEDPYEEYGISKKEFY